MTPAQSVQQGLEQARGAASRGAWTEAVSFLDELLSLHPDVPEADDAAFLRAVVLCESGNFTEALDALQKFPRQYAASPYLRRLAFWKGRAWAGLKEWGRAAEAWQLQSREKTDPSLVPMTLASLAAAYESLGRPEEALRTWQELVDSKPPAEMLRAGLLGLGLSCQSLGLRPEALNAFDRLLTEFPGTLQASQALFHTAELHFQLGDGELARSRYERFLRETSVPRALPALREGALYRLALLAGSRGEPAAALGLLERLFAEFPRTDYLLDVLPLQARWAREADRPAEARAAYELWISREPRAEERQKIAVNLGLLALSSGDSLQAALDFARASEGPDEKISADALIQRGKALLLAGQNAPAANALWEMARRFPGHPDTPQSLQAALAAWDAAGGNAAAELEILDFLLERYEAGATTPADLDHRGDLLREKGDYTGALVDFQRILREFPDWPQRPETQYKVGYLYSLRGEHRRAEAAFFRLTEELKSGELYERAILARSLAFFNAGEDEKALASLDRLERESPASVWLPRSRFYRAKFLLRAGRTGEARKGFEQAAEALGEDELASQALWEAAGSATLEKDFMGARGLYQRFVSEYPDDGRAPEGRYRSGLAAWEAGQRELAVEDWTAALAKNADAWAAETLHQLLLSALRGGNESQAQERTRELRRRFPESSLAAAAWLTRAEELGAAERWEEAAEGYLRVRDDFDGTEAARLAHWRAAALFAKLGKGGQALDLYRSYLNAYPDSPEADEVRELLKRLDSGTGGPEPASRP